jgi:molybdopterin-guanine dinucleotide biosynthesis protein
MIVVVGGSSRNAGKTTVVCEIIAATVEAQWTAWKISTHAHEVTAHGDTGRYREAGAVAAFLAQDFDPAPVSGNVIVESNTAAERFKPDLFVFVEGGGEWKPSATRVAHKADLVVRGHATPELLNRVREGLRRPGSTR